MDDEPPKPAPAGSAPASGWPKRTKKEKDEWRRKVKAMGEGDRFTYAVTGWKDKSTVYTLDTQEICFQVEEGGAIRCMHGGCVNRDFGKEPNKRAEYNLWLHITKVHEPLKKTIIAASSLSEKGDSKRKSETANKVQGNIDKFFAFSRSGHSPEKKKSKPQVKDVVPSPTTSSMEDDEPSSSKSLPLDPFKSGRSIAFGSSATPIGSTAIVSDTGNMSSSEGREMNETPSRGSNSSHSASSSNDVESPAASASSYNIESPAASSSSSDEVMVRTGTSADYMSSAEAFPRWFSAMLKIAGNSSTGSIVPCEGIAVSLPEPGHLNYPVGLSYALVQRGNNPLPFYFDSCTQRLRAVDCPMAVSASIRCALCCSLQDDVNVRNVVERARDDSLHETRIQDAYLTDRQKDAKISLLRHRLKTASLATLNHDRRLQRMTEERDDLTRLKAAMTENNVPRASVILSRAAREGRSTGAVVKMVLDAANGLYNPKQYDEDDMDMAVLALGFGGRRMVYALNHCGQGPSLNTLKAHRKTPHYTTLASSIDESIIRQNMENFLFNVDHAEDSELSICHLMMDDIKGESRVRVDDHDGEVRGLCGHADEHDISLDVRSESDCLDIRDALRDGKIHYATELTNVAIARNRETGYAPVVVATSGGCLVNDPIERTRSLLSTVIKIWKNDKRGEDKRGIISTIQPDSASQFISVGYELFMSNEMDSTHPLYSIFKRLPFFGLHCGDGDFELIALGADSKHVLKRTRARLITALGTQLTSAKIMGETLKQLILDCGLETLPKVQQVFGQGYADAMNVPAAVLFMKLVAKLGEIDPSSCRTRRATYESMARDIKHLATICDLMVRYVTDIALPLEERLSLGSTLQTVLFVNYRRSGTAFLPSQNYASWIRLVRSNYWSVALCQRNNIASYFPFMDSGDALEQTYNVLRSCIIGAKGSGSGMDIVQLGERIGGVMEIEAVYARKPHLRPKSRHLATSDDHMNPRTFLGTQDGGEDRTRIAVERVNIANAHRRGMAEGSRILKEAGFTEDELNWADIMAKNSSIDFLRPQGEFVGVTMEPDTDAPPPPIFVVLPNAETIIINDAKPSDTVGDILRKIQNNDISIGDRHLIYDGQKLDDNQTLSDCGVRRESTLHLVPSKATLMTDIIALEEAIEPAPKVDGTSAPTPRKILLDGGREVSASKLLRSILDPTLRTETSRVARNRGSIKSGTELKDTEIVSEEMIYAGEDPLVALVDSGEGATISVLIPEGFELDGKKVESIMKRKFVGEAVVEGKLVDVSVADDEVSWCISKRSAHRFTVHAKHCLGINPGFRRVEVGGDKLMKGEYYIATDSMMLLLDKLYNDYCTLEGGVVPLVSSVSFLPYRRSGSASPFVLKDAVKAVASSKNMDAKQRDKNATATCPVDRCIEKFKLSEMRQHIGWHYHHDPNFNTQENAIPKGLLCGLCGTNPMMAKTTIGAESGCPVWIDGKRPGCQCAGVTFVKFSLGAAAQCKKRSPCTNRPIICPLCPKAKKGVAATVIWSYGAEHHFETVHIGDEMPSDFKRDVMVSAEEVQLLAKWAKSKKTRSKKQMAGSSSRGSGAPSAVRDASAPPISIELAANFQSGDGGEKCGGDGASSASSRSSVSSTIPDSIFGGNGCGGNPPPELLMLRPLSTTDIEMADEIITKSSIFVDSRADDSDAGDEVAVFDRDPLHEADVATLDGREYINDNVLHFYVRMINEQTKERVSDSKDKEACYTSYVSKSYFLTKLVGQKGEAARSGKKRAVRPRFLGVKDDEVPFSGRDDSSKNLARWPGSWHQTIYGCKYVAAKGSVGEGYRPTVFDLKLNMLVLPANLTNHHWLDIAVDFDKKEIVAYDSLPVADERLDVPHTGTNVLNSVVGVTVKDLDIVMLRRLCYEFRISPVGNKLAVMYRLMRIMFVQEAFLYVKEQGAQTEPKQHVLEEEWCIYLSPAMPKQNPSNNNCCLYCCLGANILAVGKDMSVLTPTIVEEIESNGRRAMATLALNKKEQDDEDSGEVMEGASM